MAQYQWGSTQVNDLITNAKLNANGYNLWRGVPGYEDTVTLGDNVTGTFTMKPNNAYNPATELFQIVGASGNTRYLGLRGDGGIVALGTASVGALNVGSGGTVTTGNIEVNGWVGVNTTPVNGISVKAGGTNANLSGGAFFDAQSYTLGGTIYSYYANPTYNATTSAAVGFRYVPVIAAAAISVPTTAFYTSSGTKGAGANMDTQVGLHIPALANGTSNLMILLGPTIALGLGNYAIYSSSTYPALLSANLAITAGGLDVTGASTFSSTINSQTISATASFTGTMAITSTTTISGRASVGGVTNALYGLYVHGTPTTGVGRQAGVYSDITTSTDTSGTEAMGIFARVNIPSTAGTAFLQTAAVHLADPVVGFTSTVTTNYGLLVDSMGAGVTNYAIYTNNGDISLGGAVTIRTGGIAVTGNSTITGTLGSLTGLTVASGGITVTGNSTITGSLGSLTGLTVASGVTTITGTMAVSSFSAFGGAAISGVTAVLIGGDNAYPITGSAQIGLKINGKFTSGATASGTCVYARVELAAAAYTMTTGTAFYAEQVSLGAGSALTTARGLYIAPQTAATTNNYGVYIEAPSGGSGNNIGLYNAGTTTLVGALTITTGGLAVTGNLGLFGTAATTKQTITGSQGSNSALASLLAALVAYGLVTDSSSP